jgi:VWFA-related protein
MFLAAMVAALSSTLVGQPTESRPRVRTVTIPISIFTTQELKENTAQEFVQAERLTVTEDGQDQEILSIRSVGESPLSIAVVIQEDLTSSFNLQLKDIQAFIRGLPKGTRVLTAYSRSGSPQIRQRFTDDLELAAKSLRIVSGSPSQAPRSPFDAIDDLLGRFDAVPAGRRAILFFSDGLDSSEGLNLASISQSAELERAILKAQRKSVAVYSFYSPTAFTESTGSRLAFAAQGALVKLSDQTGGRAYFNGILAPISYLPFFKDLVLALNRQFALTYLSTHMNKGYHRVVVQSTNPEIRIEHPKGYYYR